MVERDANSARYGKGEAVLVLSEGGRKVSVLTRGDGEGCFWC